MQTHSVCDTLWWRVRGWQRDGEREGGTTGKREGERRDQSEGRDRGGETRMRDSSAAARARALPAFATSVYFTFPESRLSSLCVSHGSDLGEWSGGRKPQICLCLHSGQVSSLCISLGVILTAFSFYLFSPFCLCEEEQTTSAEFGSCSVCLSFSFPQS